MSMGKAVSEKYSMLLVSSMEKVFTDKEPLYFPERCAFQGLFGENVSFQVALSANTRRKERVRLKVYGDLEPYIKVRRVALVPSEYPAHSEKDGNYLRCTPGLYPDLLKELDEDGETAILPDTWQSFWIDVDITDKIKGGIYPVRVCVLKDDDTVEIEVTANIEVIPISLPKLTLYHTEWFHCDCLADYYKVSPFSEKHWEILKNFIEVYVKRGGNTILTPVFTPPLDTDVGGERTTVQLVGITESDGRYLFDFNNLERWIALCSEAGIEYFEIAHFFTQWGAGFAPKIMVNKNGRDIKRFGWDTPAVGEYTVFLEQFIPALKTFLLEKNLLDKTFFHISDEPREEHIEEYEKARLSVLPYLKDCKIIDALSDYKFYEKGLVDIPVCAINHIEPFIENKVPHLWSYYCTSQYESVSNRFFSMPLARTRIYGILVYKFGMEGILHWGFNFYNSQFSKKAINPYEVTDCGCSFPSGDAFLVYPGEDGKPEESIRLMAMNEALQDYRALKLLEAKIGKTAVIELLEDGLSEPITFFEYPKSPEYLIMLRRKINSILIRDEKV